MSKLFDTHAHILDEAFADDREDVLTRTLTQCGAIMNIGCESLEDFQSAVALAHHYEQIFAAVALHPQNAPQDTPELWSRLETLAADPQVRAIGETGLDYHWMTADKETQIALFQRHIALARRLNKPLIIHNRDAHRDCLDTLWAAGGDAVGGVFHAYSGSVELMKEVVAHGFFIGLGGVVTFKNAKTAKLVAQAVPLEHLLIETDCPYLTPVPHRGKRNEPAYVRYVAEAIAELRGIRYEEVLAATWQNACRLYRLDPDTLALQN